MICTIARNLCVEKGLVKNARVIVQSCEQHSIGIRLLNQYTALSNEEISLPRITFNFTPKFSSWSVNRRQFPLRPAYATTFNSCQGLTLDYAVLDLSQPVFAHGQLYTGISRVRNRSNIAILLSHTDQCSTPQKSLFQTTTTVQNIVYQSFLQ